MTIEGQPDLLTVAQRGAADIKYVVIHHSATAGGNVEAFRRNHLKRGFHDVGYHYIICNGNGGPNGEVQEGRPILLTGAHAPGRNNDSIGICLVGDFTTGSPTMEQLSETYKLIKSLHKRYPITPDRVLGHNEVNATACPGSLDVAAVRVTLSKPPVPKALLGKTFVEGVMIGNRMYVPVREFVTALNAELTLGIDWDMENRIAKITTRRL